MWDPDKILNQYFNHLKSESPEEYKDQDPFQGSNFGLTENGDRGLTNSDTEVLREESVNKHALNILSVCVLQWYKTQKANVIFLPYKLLLKHNSMRKYHLIILNSPPPYFVLQIIYSCL